MCHLYLMNNLYKIIVDVINDRLLSTYILLNYYEVLIVELSIRDTHCKPKLFR